jgi:hypothetical protein
VGATFLLTTSDVEGAELVLLSPTSTMAKQRIVPGQILAGAWANHPHCNINVQGSKTTRTSWGGVLQDASVPKKGRGKRKIVLLAKYNDLQVFYFINIYVCQEAI